MAKTSAASSDAETAGSVPAAPDTASALRTPSEWGQQYFTGTPTRIHPELWKHAAASQLHGWGNFERVTGAPFQISESDYLAAIAAVSGSAMTPHPAALATLPKLTKEPS